MGPARKYLHPTGGGCLHLSLSILLLGLFLAFAFTIEVVGAKAITTENQQRIEPPLKATSFDSQDRSQGGASIGRNSTQSYKINRRVATQPTKGPIIVNSEFLKQSLLNNSERSKRKVSDAVTKDDAASDVGAFVDHTSSESKAIVDVSVNNGKTDYDGKVIGGSSGKARPALSEAQSEENEVLSPKEMTELKPKEKKLRELQHHHGVNRAIAEEEFDFEHYFDKIPSYDYNESNDKQTNLRSEDFGGFKVESRSQIQQVSSSLTPLGISLTPDVSMMRKILELLGLEDTSYVDHHLREADTTVRATVAREKQKKTDHHNDDDLVIVKSVRVNVRKVP